MLAPCYVLLRITGIAFVEGVRVYLDLDAAKAAKSLVEWDRDAARFTIVESVIELPETR